ncbi:transglutaminase family protein [soil metagenome]
MPILTISHVTTYRYRQLVAFGEHRVMVRPRESYDQWVIDATLEITPRPADVRWVQDVFGNSVALARFDRRATELTFDSRIRMEHTPVEPERVDIEAYAREYPFTYSSEDMPDLLRSIERQHHDPDRIVDAWARRFLHPTGRTATLDLLTAMTTTIKRDFSYIPRPDQGTQTPVETIRARQGTCRDYAVLMIEAVRSLGFAARFVSGYVYSPSHHEGRVGGGNTHAWVRIFIPGSGWVEFDPTNGIVGNRGLIRVAVARDPFQALPLSGSWTGFPNSALPMTVSVDITVEPDAAQTAPDTPSPATSVLKPALTPASEAT